MRSGANGQFKSEISKSLVMSSLLVPELIKVRIREIIRSNLSRKILISAFLNNGPWPGTTVSNLMPESGPVLPPSH